MGVGCSVLFLNGSHGHLGQAPPDSGPRLLLAPRRPSASGTEPSWPGAQRASPAPPPAPLLWACLRLPSDLPSDRTATGRGSLTPLPLLSAGGCRPCPLATLHVPVMSPVPSARLASTWCRGWHVGDPRPSSESLNSVLGASSPSWSAPVSPGARAQRLGLRARLSCRALTGASLSLLKVIRTTGFMKGLYTDTEMKSENVKVGGPGVGAGLRPLWAGVSRFPAGCGCAARLFSARIAGASPVFSLLVTAFTLVCALRNRIVLWRVVLAHARVLKTPVNCLFCCRDSVFLNWTCKKSFLCKQELCLLNMLRSTPFFEVSHYLHFKWETSRTKTQRSASCRRPSTCWCWSRASRCR